MYTSVCKHLRKHAVVSADGRIIPAGFSFSLSSLTLRDPDRGHFDPHGGVCDLRLSSREFHRFSDNNESLGSGTESKRGMIVAVVVIVDASRRVFLNHIRGDEMRKEEATKSARRCQEQRDKGPDLGRRHASALLPLTSAARFRPPRTSPSDFFSRGYRKHCPFSLPKTHARARVILPAAALSSFIRHLSPRHLFVNCQCRSSCSSSVALLRDCTASTNDI